MKMFYEKDVDIVLIKDKKNAIFGYGSQGQYTQIMISFRMKKILIFLSVLLLITTNSVLAEEKKTLLDLLKKKPKTEISGSTSEKSNTGTVTLKKCENEIATVGVVEPQDFVMQALYQHSLPSPTQLIRLMIQQSKCFIVVERGLAFQNLMQERELASEGELKSDQNVGKGQLVTADYILTPTVIFKNKDAGGLAGVLGTLIPGTGGSVAGAIGGSLKFKEAQTSLTLSDTRSGIQVAAASGISKKTDLGVVGGLGIKNAAAAGIGAYQNTAEGKVVAAAFLISYNMMVDTVKNDKNLVRKNSVLNYKKEGSKEIKKVKKNVIGNVKIAKIDNVPVYKDVSGKKIIYKLVKKEEIVILGEDGEYYNIQGAQGEGWVKKILVK